MGEAGRERGRGGPPGPLAPTPLLPPPDQIQRGETGDQGSGKDPLRPLTPGLVPPAAARREALSLHHPPHPPPPPSRPTPEKAPQTPLPRLLGLGDANPLLPPPGRRQRHPGQGGSGPFPLGPPPQRPPPSLPVDGLREPLPPPLPGLQPHPDPHQWPHLPEPRPLLAAPPRGGNTRHLPDRLGRGVWGRQPPAPPGLGEALPGAAPGLPVPVSQGAQGVQRSGRAQPSGRR